MAHDDEQILQAVSAASPAAPARAPDVTIVLPTYNERENVRPMVERLDAVLVGLRWEAIFVDDDSPDKTWIEARAVGDVDPRVRCIRRVHDRGRASACIAGMLAAQAPLVAVMDADLQHDVTALPRMIDLLRRNGLDLVVATRYAEGGSSEGLHGIRRTISRGAGLLASFLLGARLSDPTSGYFLVRRDLIDTLARELSTEGFNTSLDIASTRTVDIKIGEVPASFGPRLHGASKLDARIAVDFAALILSRLTFSVLPQRFLLFAVVGASGLLVHFVSLAAIQTTLQNFAHAQLLAAFVAAASNFWLNNVFTFRERTLRGTRALVGLVLYAVICSFGIVSNVGVATWIFSAGSTWWVAGIAGAMVSVVWNYAVSTALIWRRA